MRGGCACPEPCSGKARFDSTLEILQTEDLHSIGQAGEIIYCVVSTIKKKNVGAGWRGNLWNPMEKSSTWETQINKIETVKDIISS